MAFTCVERVPVLSVPNFGPLRFLLDGCRLGYSTVRREEAGSTALRLLNMQGYAR